MKKISKNILVIVMTICLLILTLPLIAKADNNDSVNRYTVLVLDTSTSSGFYYNGELIYTADTAIDDVKKASKKFLSDVTEANGNNNIAIVSYKEEAEVVSGFTQDIDDLKSDIDDLSASGIRSISEGLMAADSLLESVSDENAIKNIVLFTTGMTNGGGYNYIGHYNEDTVGSNWQRMDTEVKLYAYANVAYEKAMEIKEKGSYIYSIGMFQTMEGIPEEGKEIAEFFKLTAEDLASGPDYFYSVYNPDDLEFVFGEVADDVINDNKDRDPIIVIPGIMGSRLFTSNSVFDNTTKAWDPVVSIEGVTQLNERLALSNTLYVRPCENQNVDTSVKNDASTVDDYGKEYGAQGTYKAIVDSLCETFSYKDQDKYRPIYVFSYDWRYSNEKSAKLLKEEINKILKETGASKVDFVCHSMGGLVASSYYSQFSNENKVDKIITCGTPYEGAPKLINAVENWDVLGTDALFSDHASVGTNAIDIGLGLFGGMTKKLKSSFSGVAELTPTKNYVGKCPMQKDSAWPLSWGDYNLTYEDYVKQCKKIFTEDRYNNAVEFQDSLLNDDGFNKLLDYNNSYFSVGINHATICAIKFQCINQDIDEKLYESDLEYTILGDGTVPYLSASIINKIESLSKQGVRWNQFDADHGETITGEEPIKWITNILETGKSNVEGAEKNSGAHTVVRIACPVDVSIEVNGEKLESEKDGLSIIADFGRLDFVGQEDEIKIVCFNNNENYNIDMHGTDEGTMDYIIRFYDNNEELVDERKFEGVPVSENTTITTDTNENNDTILLIDDNGDGQFDSTWTAGENERVTESDVARICGTDRYKTSYKVADIYKETLGVDKFDAAIVATGKNFADALAGSYLAVRKDAPILLTNGKNANIAELHAYIATNVVEGGKIYILGGESAVPASVDTIEGYDVVRLFGGSRYDTNLAILKEAGTSGDSIIVATGKTFADSLSASASKLPILLVKPNETLNDAQKEILAGMRNIYIIGGEAAVSEAYEAELKEFGEVTRIYGQSRYDTSIEVAKTFCTNVKMAIVASGENFPDGLCGGPLAATLNAPLVLTKDNRTAAAAAYVTGNGISSGFVLGGDGALSNDTVEAVFGLESAE